MGRYKKKDFLRTGPKCRLYAVSRTHAREPISCLLFTFLRRPSRRGGGRRRRKFRSPGGPRWKWPVTPICTEPPPLTQPLRHVGVKGRVRGKNNKQQHAGNHSPSLRESVWLREHEEKPDVDWRSVSSLLRGSWTGSPSWAAEAIWTHRCTQVLVQPGSIT